CGRGSRCSRLGPRGARASGRCARTGAGRGPRVPWRRAPPPTGPRRGGTRWSRRSSRGPPRAAASWRRIAPWAPPRGARPSRTSGTRWRRTERRSSPRRAPRGANVRRSCPVRRGGEQLGDLLDRGAAVQHHHPQRDLERLPAGDVAGLVPGEARTDADVVGGTHEPRIHPPLGLGVLHEDEAGPGPAVPTLDDERLAGGAVGEAFALALRDEDPGLVAVRQTPEQAR